jgi:predicted metal-dependent phosphoesterase TrpH
MKIDLQIHTTYSDGNHTPQEIAELAHKGGLNVISVTDHDRVDSYGEVKEACDALDIRAISGVEISTTYNGRPLHILGYSIDVKNTDLVSFLKGINEFRKNAFIERFPILNENLRQAGKQEADVEKFRNLDARYYSGPGVAEFLFEQGITQTKGEGFLYFKGMKGTVPPIEPKDAIFAIHKAGGKAILSHPFAPKISLAEITSDKSEQEAMIALFKEQGLDGLECYQAGHNEENVAFCLELAKKYNLSITAGSDWHGYHLDPNDPIRDYLPYYIAKLGDLYVPEEKCEQIITSLT